MCLLPCSASMEMEEIECPAVSEQSFQKCVSQGRAGVCLFLEFPLGNCVHYQKGISDKVSPGASLVVVEVQSWGICSPVQVKPGSQ